MTLAQRDDLVRRMAEHGVKVMPLGFDRLAAASKKKLDQEAARTLALELALEFWAKNQEQLEAAGWSEDYCVGMMCRCQVEIRAAKIEGKYIIFNGWTRAKAR